MLWKKGFVSLVIDEVVFEKVRSRSTLCLIHVTWYIPTSWYSLSIYNWNIAPTYDKDEDGAASQHRVDTAAVSDQRSEGVPTVGETVRKPEPYHQPSHVQHNWGGEGHIVPSPKVF